MNEKGLALLLSAILVISMVAVMPAIASDWQQFQKDEVNIGRTDDSAPLGVNYGWRVFTHTDQWMAAGIGVTPIIADGKVFVIDAQGYAWAFYPENGTKIWNRSLHSGNRKFELATPAYADGTVFFATNNDGHIYALYAANGSIKWHNSSLPKVGSYTQLNTLITYANDRIYVGSWNSSGEKNGTYYCLYAANGTVAWNRSANTGQGYYWSGAAVIGDYLVYGDLASNVTSVYKINGTTKDEINITKNAAEGGVSFNKSNASAILSSIAYVPHNDTAGFIYFTSGDYPGRYWPTGGYAWKIGINKSTGEFFDEGWSTNWIDGGSTSTPSVYDGRVYVGIGGSTWHEEDADFYCLNASDGNDTKWTFTPNGIVQSSPALSIQNGDPYIYFTTNCQNGRAYCLNKSGSEVWNFTTFEAGGSGGHILQGAAISNGWIYFGNDGGYLYGLSNVTPDAFEGQVSSKPPSAANDPSGAIGSYSAISTDDGTYEPYQTTSNNNYAAQRFNVSIDQAATNISTINVTWNGKGWHSASSGLKNGTHLYMYNFTAGSYRQLNSTTSGADVDLTGSVSTTLGISNYISSSNVTVLVEQKEKQTSSGPPSGRGNSHIETDYVRVIVTTT